jgi:hypothetical protein
MGVHMMAEGAVVSCGPVTMRLKLVRSFRGKSRGGSGMSTMIVGLGVIDFWSLVSSDGTKSGGEYI